MKSILFMAAIACASIGGNAYGLKTVHNTQQALDSCARENNVYRCQLAAIPSEAPRVDYRTAELLPPPVIGGH